MLFTAQGKASCPNVNCDYIAEKPVHLDWEDLLGLLGNFLDLGKISLILGRFCFWVNFNKLWAKNRQLIISGHIFTIGQHWIFKSVDLATNTLHLVI